MEFASSLALLPLKLGFRLGPPLTDDAHLVSGRVFVFLRWNAFFPVKVMAGSRGRELLVVVFAHIKIVPPGGGLQKGFDPQGSEESRHPGLRTGLSLGF